MEREREREREIAQVQLLASVFGIKKSLFKIIVLMLLTK
jgi:hypothetical protein